MKKLLLFLLILLANVAFSQKVAQSIVYLKDGSIITGKIIEQVPNEYIKVQTSDNTVTTYKFDEIAKITKDDVNYGESYTDTTGKKFDFDGGFGLGLGIYSSKQVTKNACFTLNGNFALWIGNVAPRIDFGLTVNPELITLPIDFSVLYRIYDRHKKINNILYPYFGGGLSYMYGKFDLGFNYNKIEVNDLGLCFTAGLKVKFFVVELKYGFGFTVSTNSYYKETLDLGGVRILLGFRW